MNNTVCTIVKAVDVHLYMTKGKSMNPKVFMQISVCLLPVNLYYFVEPKPFECYTFKCYTVPGTIHQRSSLALKSLKSKDHMFYLQSTCTKSILLLSNIECIICKTICQRENPGRYQCMNVSKGWGACIQ